MQKRKNLSLEEYVEGIKIGNTAILSQAITVIESNHAKHATLGAQILESALPKSGNSVRIGITGVPGVGKSTFIESFGLFLAEQDYKVAVLTIDPTSPSSKGSILGDKTRMPKLSGHQKVFIRPSPSGTTLGGVASKTRETMLLCEAAGYDIILVETVGVGQSEIAVHSMVDCFLLLMLAGAGDELQGIKRGIMEMADLVLINKADGSNKTLTKQAKSSYQNALHLFPQNANSWTPKVETCSGLTGAGIDNVWSIITSFFTLIKSNQHLQIRRKDQANYWLQQSIDEQLRIRFFENKNVQKEFQMLRSMVDNNSVSPFRAAKQLIDLFEKR